LAFIKRYTAHHLDTVSDPSTETSLLSRQSNCLHTADDILVYPAQPFGTACRIISETLLYLWTFLGAINRVILVWTPLTFSDALQIFNVTTFHVRRSRGEM